jgi:hypothetical protein
MKIQHAKCGWESKLFKENTKFSNEPSALTEMMSFIFFEFDALFFSWINFEMILQFKKSFSFYFKFQICQWTENGYANKGWELNSWNLKIIVMLKCRLIFCLKFYMLMKLFIMYEKSISKVWKKISIINEKKIKLHKTLVDWIKVFFC